MSLQKLIKLIIEGKTYNSALYLLRQVIKEN